MDSLRNSLNTTIQYIDAIVQTRIERRGNLGVVGVPWKEDPELRAIMTDLKSQAQIISHSAVKFALLVNTSSPTDNNLKRNITSICNEISPQIGTFYNIFLRVTECAVAECLFDEASKCVRSMLGIFAELLGCIKDRNRDAINYTAGEMTKVLSDVAEQLPVANKAAYRRYLSQKCKSLKEIIDEFSGYVNEANEAIAKKAISSSPVASESATDEAAHVFEKLSIAEQQSASAVTVDDADEEEDEENDFDDMEERDYYSTELPLVEGAITVIQRSLDAVKVVTVAITNVSDTLLATAASADTDADRQENINRELIPESNAWVIRILTMVDRIESVCVDLGAALYPPVLPDNEDLIQAHSMNMMLLQALVEDTYQDIVPETSRYHSYCDMKIQQEIVKIRDNIIALPETLTL